MKIDFSRLQVKTSLGGDATAVVDMQLSFADVVYTRGSGVEAHSLAFKIFNGNGDTEYNDRECELIEYYATLCAPFFIDAINDAINKQR